MNVFDIREYVPDQSEEYMNDKQLLYFRNRLNTWQAELIESSRSRLNSLKETSLRKPDDVEASAAQVDMALDFQARDRQQRLIEQIAYALSRIEDGEYGYCEITGEEIGLKRLLASPTATLCVEVQEHRERLAAGTVRFEIPS